MAWLGCVAGLARPCRRPGPTMSQAWPGCIVALCHRAPSLATARHIVGSLAMSQGARRRIAALAAVYHDPDSPPSATIQNFVSWPSASQAARCIVTQKAAPQPRYKFVSRLPLAKPCACVHYRMPHVQADRIVACIVALPHRVMGVAWPYSGHALAAPKPVSLALCQDTIYCILTQMVSSPSSCLLSNFFSHLFFFFFFFICSTY